MRGRHRGNSAKTFTDILETVARKNAQSLMERAHIANRLAKSLSGPSRQRAYAIKTEALVGLVRKFPEHTIVLNDVRTPRYVLIKSANGCFGLHGPVHRFRSDNSISLKDMRERTEVGRQEAVNRPGRFILRGVRNSVSYRAQV